MYHIKTQQVYHEKRYFIQELNTQLKSFNKDSLYSTLAVVESNV